MIEVLVALAILAVLILIILLFLPSPVNRAKDARTKKDIHQLQVAFEDYYTDNHCYPPAEWFDNADDCGSSQFAPYINKIKCDPKTNLPYQIEYDETSCGWYRIYTDLYFPDEELCRRYSHAGGEFNYGVAASNTDLVINCELEATPTPSDSTTPSPSPGASPTPSPTPNEGSFYCQEIDNCTWYDNTTWTCSPNYFTASCDGECGDQTGSCVQD